MQILLVTPEVSNERSPTGGLANYIRRFSSSLVDFGHTLTVLTYGRNARVANLAGVVVETVPERGPKWMTALDILTVRTLTSSRTLIFRTRSIAQRVVKLIGEGGVDIVQYPNLDALSLFHPGTIPSVIRFSSDTLLAQRFGGYDLEKPWTIKQRCYWETVATRKCDALCAPSALIAGIVGQRLNRTVDIIRPPVFPDNLDPDPTVLRKAVGVAPFLLFVGNINRLKGIPILTEIIHKVLDNHRDVHLVITGREGQPNMTKALLQAAGDHSSRVHVTGVLPRKSLIPFLSQARAIVQPSLIDNLPNTLLEGLLYGRIVIGTRGASFDEMITDGVNGLLCERNDPQSLLAAIEKALNLDSANRAVIEAAARRCVSQLAPKFVVPATISYFENVISGYRQRKTSRVRYP